MLLNDFRDGAFEITLFRGDLERLARACRERAESIIGPMEGELAWMTANFLTCAALTAQLYGMASLTKEQEAVIRESFATMMGTRAHEEDEGND